MLVHVGNLIAVSPVHTVNKQQAEGQHKPTVCKKSKRKYAERSWEAGSIGNRSNLHRPRDPVPYWGCVFVMLIFAQIDFGASKYADNTLLESAKTFHFRGSIPRTFGEGLFLGYTHFVMPPFGGTPLGCISILKLDVSEFSRGSIGSVVNGGCQCPPEHNVSTFHTRRGVRMPRDHKQTPSDSS